jgi:hypothetical protein
MGPILIVSGWATTLLK